MLLLHEFHGLCFFPSLSLFCCCRPRWRWSHHSSGTRRSSMASRHDRLLSQKAFLQRRMVSLESRCGRFSSSLYVCDYFSFLFATLVSFLQGSSGTDKGGGTVSNRSPQEGRTATLLLLFTLLDLSILFFASESAFAMSLILMKSMSCPSFPSVPN